MNTEMWVLSHGDETVKEFLMMRVINRQRKTTS